MSINPLEKINGTLGLVKDLAAVKSEVDQLELRKKLIEVESGLLEAKGASMDLQEENRELKAQIAIQHQIIDEPNAACIYLVKDGIKVPHCRFCYEDSGKLYQLSNPNKRDARCHKCQNYFVINPNVPHESAVISHSPRRRSMWDRQF